MATRDDQPNPKDAGQDAGRQDADSPVDVDNAGSARVYALWEEAESLLGTLPTEDTLRDLVSLYQRWPVELGRDERLVPLVAEVLQHWPSLQADQPAPSWVELAPGAWLGTPPFHELRPAPAEQLSLWEPETLAADRLRHLKPKPSASAEAMESALLDMIFYDDAQLQGYSQEYRIPFHEAARRCRERYAAIVDSVFPQRPEKEENVEVLSLSSAKQQN